MKKLEKYDNWLRRKGYVYEKNTFIYIGIFLDVVGLFMIGISLKTNLIELFILSIMLITLSIPCYFIKIPLNDELRRNFIEEYNKEIHLQKEVDSLK